MVCRLVEGAWYKAPSISILVTKAVSGSAANAVLAVWRPFGGTKTPFIRTKTRIPAERGVLCVIDRGHDGCPSCARKTAADCVVDYALSNLLRTSRTSVETESE